MWANTFNQFDPASPFGGYKESGFGREGGRHGLAPYLQLERRGVSERLDVRKTYKLYVGGQFPRSESGRTYPVSGPDGGLLAHAVLGSRKDLRDAVKAARGAQAGWAGKTAYNRAQILYRVGEIMEGRRSQFVDELAAGGVDDPEGEVDASIDRWVWYAGWADKLPSVLGGANAVAGPYFNFTVPEPTGVVGLIAPDEAPLLALVSRLAPIIVSGQHGRRPGVGGPAAARRHPERGAGHQRRARRGHQPPHR